MTAPQRRIVCAAIRQTDQIICGARHFDHLMIQQIEGRDERNLWRTAEQGFVDQYRAMLSAAEAEKDKP